MEDDIESGSELLANKWERILVKGFNTSSSFMVTKKRHQDNITDEGHNSLTHYNLVCKLIPIPQAMKNIDAKSAVNTEWETVT